MNNGSRTSKVDDTNLLLETLQQMTLTGEEDLHQLIQNISNISVDIYKFSLKIFGGLVDLTNVIRQRYDLLLQAWNNDLYGNLSQINEEKFTKYIVEIIPYQTLLTYLDTIARLQYTLSNIKQVCEAPVHGSDWKTNGLTSIAHQLEQIGFNFTQFNLTQQTSSTYKSNKEKQQLGLSRYSSSDLPVIIQKTIPITKHAQKSYIKKITKDVIDYSNQLTEEKNLLDSMGISQSDKQKKLDQVNIKIMRLWWVSQFIKISYLLTSDIIADIIKLCKIAKRCMEKE